MKPDARELDQQWERDLERRDEARTRIAKWEAEQKRLEEERLDRLEELRDQIENNAFDKEHDR